MTQAFNLSQLGNNINSSGQVSLTAGITGTLPIANGGTNLTSAGTSGYVMTSNGSAFTMVAPSGGQPQYALYTSGTSTWTCPAGVTRVKVTVFGGGGGGDDACGGNGGQGGRGWNYYTVTPSTGYTVTIGAAGTGTGTVGQSGTAGGTTSFGSLISATGGGGGNNNIDGAHGSCANSLVYTIAAPINSNVASLSSAFNFIGNNVSDTGVFSGTAWTASGGKLPGALGNGGNGGIGGACLIEYIG